MWLAGGCMRPATCHNMVYAPVDTNIWYFHIPFSNDVVDCESMQLAKTAFLVLPKERKCKRIKRAAAAGSKLNMVLSAQIDLFFPPHLWFGIICVWLAIDGPWIIFAANSANQIWSAAAARDPIVMRDVGVIINDDPRWSLALQAFTYRAVCKGWQKNNYIFIRGTFLCVYLS
jgi:hypothetical protein